EGSRLRGLPAALPADHDDHAGGDVRRPAAGAQPRRGCRAPPAAGHRDRGRAHREPGAHALHHSGDLPLPRPPAGVDRPCARRPPTPPVRPCRETHGGAHAVKRSLVLSLLSAALVAGGCSVGPNYVRPDAPTSDSFKELEGWRTARPRDDVLRAAWWGPVAGPAPPGLVAP